MNNMNDGWGNNCLYYTTNGSYKWSHGYPKHTTIILKIAANLTSKRRDWFFHSNQVIGTFSHHLLPSSCGFWLHQTMNVVIYWYIRNLFSVCTCLGRCVSLTAFDKLQNLFPVQNTPKHASKAGTFLSLKRRSKRVQMITFFPDLEC
jgi:hypothetical protein